MCRFCDSNSEKRLMIYDNHKSMEVCMGQYKGVNVSAELSMKGNTLILKGNGSYRSAHDCYYETQGIECDGVYSSQSKSEYIKIEYCPFCGKKLDSTVFEKNDLKETIKSVENKLHKAKVALGQMVLQAAFTLYTKSKETDKKAYELIWDDKTGASFNTMVELGEVKVKVYYGNETENEYEFPPFDPDERIPVSHYFGNQKGGGGTYYGACFSLTEEQYNMLADKGFIKKNPKKLKEMKAKQDKFQEDIENLEKKLDSLKNKLKTL